MKVRTNLSEFVRVDRDFTEYDACGEPKRKYKDIKKFLHFQAAITKDDIRISAGYTDSDTSVNCWYNTYSFDFKKGVVPFSDLVEWYKDLDEALLMDDHPKGIEQHLIDTMDAFINKSQKIYAMYQEGLL